MFEKVVVIDARGHLMGRLASYVAKQLLSGTKNIIIQVKELLSYDVKESTFQAHFLEIKLNLQNF